MAPQGNWNRYVKTENSANRYETWLNKNLLSICLMASLFFLTVLASLNHLLTQMLMDTCKQLSQGLLTLSDSDMQNLASTCQALTESTEKR